jgi:hypothetical protein
MNVNHSSADIFDLLHIGLSADEINKSSTIDECFRAVRWENFDWKFVKFHGVPAGTAESGFRWLLLAIILMYSSMLLPESSPYLCTLAIRHPPEFGFFSPLFSATRIPALVSCSGMAYQGLEFLLFHTSIYQGTRRMKFYSFNCIQPYV